MGDWHSGNSRSGLSSRSRAPGDSHLQISVEGEFDFDQEIEGLRSQVQKLKHVTHLSPFQKLFFRRSVEALTMKLTSKANFSIKWYFFSFSLARTPSQREAMEKTQHQLKRVSKKLNKVYEQSKSNHLLWLVLFVFCIIFAVWMLAKITHMTRTLTKS